MKLSMLLEVKDLEVVWLEKNNDFNKCYIKFLYKKRWYYTLWLNSLIRDKTHPNILSIVEPKDGDIVFWDTKDKKQIKLPSLKAFGLMYMGEDLIEEQN